MEALIGLFFLIAIWLTVLTVKLKAQKRENRQLRFNNKIYLRELLKLGYGKEEDKETET